MALEFAMSQRSTVGLEWELMLVDPVSGSLVSHAPEILATLEPLSERERFTITGELFTNTIEITSGVGSTVGHAMTDISDAIDAINGALDRRRIALMCAGSHPFATWSEQVVTDNARYHNLIERTQWWGRNMLIWGIHVHVGVEDVRKVMPLVGALTAYLPHLQALSASSPFWAGESTGYASNRSLIFQQLPTAGLPWALPDWAAFEAYLDEMVRTGVMVGAKEVHWDVRPSPTWGTIEVRACDGMSTMEELAAVAALIQSLVEYFSRKLDTGKPIPSISPWIARENKWRAARFGLDADIVTPDGVQERLRDQLVLAVDTVTSVADELGCGRELGMIADIMRIGAGYERQLAVAAQSDGDLTAVVQHLVAEFDTGEIWMPAPIAHA